MPRIKGGKKPKWTRDEIIIILSLYKNLAIKKVPHENILQAYSNILDRLAKIKGIKSNDNGAPYRSYSSVGLRIANFIHLDDFNNPNKKGLHRFSKLVREIWDEFSENPIGLEQEAKRIIKSIDSEIKAKNPIEYDVGGNFVSEGAKKIIREHKSRERNPAIVIQKKEAVKKEKGFLACEVCGFIFKDTYGKHGEDFIECHHKKPIAQMKIGDKTFPTDLALVCSNCHRMIHRTIGDRKDCLTIEELRKIIAKNKSK